jgi:hypothetical protein
VTGYPAAGNKGFNTLNECTEAWQKMCPLGVHPHPVEPVLPEYARATVSAVVETPPPKSTGKTRTSATKYMPKPKFEETPAQLPIRANNTCQLPIRANSCVCFSLFFWEVTDAALQELAFEVQRNATAQPT